MSANLRRIAVVGAGPAGMYVADALLFQTDVPVEVDLFERLPAPFGLLRYGVAPDHLKIKALARALQRTLDDDRVRFFGDVEVGVDLTVQELRTGYDAVFYTYGAPHDRRLGVPGEDLEGSRSATDFVSWYSGHPDSKAFSLDGVMSVVVIGVGNVAVDVARVLVKSVPALASTDVPQPVLDVLEASPLTDVHVLGRRGPVQAKFTSKELRELGDLEGVDVVVRPEDLVLTTADRAALDDDPGLARTHALLSQWSGRPLTGAARRLHLHFWTRPLELQGDRRVETVRVERTRLEAGRLVSDGLEREVPAQLVLRSVGYLGAQVEGVPFAEGSGTVPHDGGRVHRDGAVSPGEYVAGWIGRGPTGVLGTNRSDADAVVQVFLSDVDGLPRTTPLDVEALLVERGVSWVSCDGWTAIDRAEIALGSQRGRTRTKLHTWQGLRDAGRP